MNYDETSQKRILREMERDLLAIIAIDLETDEYEVIYSGGAYRNFENRYHNKDFFAAWNEIGIKLVFDPDRERMRREVSKECLLDKLSENRTFYTICRFFVEEGPIYCRIKVARDVLKRGDLVMGVRNVDQEIRQQREHLAEVLELQETLKRMRTKSFTSQMQPHFLYNALSSIREIVLTNPEYAADLLFDFTTHLRASIRAMASDEEIWFSQELENIKAYVSIEKMRFGDRLNVVYDVDAPEFRIIPFGIQPLVENAIRHGVYERGAAGGTVVLKVRSTEDSWDISVTDDGVGFDFEEITRQVESGERDSTGLNNLIFRLENMVSICTTPLGSGENHGTSDADGNVVFAKLDYGLEDCGKTFAYYIAEAIPDGDESYASVLEHHNLVCGGYRVQTMRENGKMKPTSSANNACKEIVLTGITGPHGGHHENRGSCCQGRKRPYSPGYGVRQRRRPEGPV